MHHTVAVRSRLIRSFPQASGNPKQGLQDREHCTLSRDLMLQGDTQPL
jgi:hypothetical protein